MGSIHCLFRVNVHLLIISSPEQCCFLTTGVYLQVVDAFIIKL